MHRAELIQRPSLDHNSRLFRAKKPKQLQGSTAHQRSFLVLVRLGLVLCLMTLTSACGPLFRVQKNSAPQIACPEKAMRKCDVEGFQIGTETNADTAGELAIVTRTKLLECSALNDAKAECITQNKGKK